MLQEFEPRRDAGILVVGDVMLDRYVYGVSERISPEAPVPVIRITGSEERPGGAANVALNIKSLGMDVQLIGITGADDAAASLLRLLSGAGIQCHLASLPELPTITKVRVISQQQQLLRLDYESHQARGDACVPIFQKLLADAACVVLSDYAKGALDRVGDMIDAAAAAGKSVLVDPKGADFGRYRGATMLTPNQREFEAVVGPCRDDDDLEAKGRKLGAELGLRALLVTRGERGMTLIEMAGGDCAHMRAHSHEVFDVTGAGDTVIGVAAAAIASGYSLRQAVNFANVAAGKVVERLGTAALSVAELNAALVPARPASSRMIEPDRIRDIARAARLRGERVVMTNGCFDLLHAGHVEYLETSRRLGDRLLVAVNSDASVRRLKGAGRPLNPLAARMRVLAGLACVDWVTWFSEDTPAMLVEQLRPDVLVKGGDYTIDQVAGAQTVQSYGGRVEILPFIAGHSTSAVIAAIAAEGST
ncbi:MAG: bifunctional D-glycero-beta-D-manno-heptose-7-phosphate kinase/D-glycero-beta-D-manno-heptose 1-phosphate adenylyltransferase HldE [Gammaproteobacteria bacterium]|nr:bifunctional D-glycero-beta-D-manno-heptose-7-phosphate kinase/D-glycero-beta-D-manno-heptose 1-phosphate adenylyltransferase HldE [Gammaproteobacteria bacterium]